MDRSIHVFTSRTNRWRTLAYLLVLLAVWVGLGIVLRRQLGWLLDPVAVRREVRTFGVLAPLVFFLLQAAQVVVAPIPGQVLALAAGYLFGTLVGTMITVVGATAGSYVAFVLARRYGRSYVERVVEPGILERFDALSHDHGLKVLFLVFLFPGLPDDLICFTAGLTDLRIRKMVAVSLVGRIPGFFLVAAAGAGIADRQFVTSAVLLGVVVLASLLVYLRRERILDWIERV